jgi:hypothetical protein
MNFVGLTANIFEYNGGYGALSEACGHAHAVVQYPDWQITPSEDSCQYAEDRAKAVFTSPGSALSELCARPKIDCSLGITVIGIASGAAVGAIAAGLPDLPFPIKAVGMSQTGTIGECLSNAALGNSLPKEMRRSIISSTDGKFGSTPAEVLAMQKELSGYDCGEDYDCIQPDGSGYYVFDSDTIGKPLPHGLWFLWAFRGQGLYSYTELFKWTIASITPDDAPDVCKPGCEPQYSLPAPSSRRRLLFAIQPSNFCVEPDMADFGTYLVNEWYDLHVATAQAIFG